VCFKLFHYLGHAVEGVAERARLRDLKRARWHWRWAAN